MRRLLYLLLLISLINIAYAATQNQFAAETYDGRQSVFLGTHDSMLNFLIPAILLFVVLVSFAVDFGTVGVSAVSVFSLFLLWVIGIIYLNVASLTTFILMMVILIFKISRS
jgi:hypothetical protein